MRLFVCSILLAFLFFSQFCFIIIIFFLCSIYAFIYSPRILCVCIYSFTADFVCLFVAHFFGFPFPFTVFVSVLLFYAAFMHLLPNVVFIYSPRMLCLFVCSLFLAFLFRSQFFVFTRKFLFFFLSSPSSLFLLLL